MPELLDLTKTSCHCLGNIDTDQATSPAILHCRAIIGPAFLQLPPVALRARYLLLILVLRSSLLL